MDNQNNDTGFYGNQSYGGSRYNSDGYLGNRGYSGGAGNTGYGYGSAQGSSADQNGYGNTSGKTGYGNASGTTGYGSDPGSTYGGSRKYGQGIDDNGSAGGSRRLGRGMEDNDPQKSRSGKKKSGKSAKGKKIRRIIILAVAEIITLAGIFGYAYVQKQVSRIQRPEVDIEEVKNENLSVESIKKMEEGYWNIAVYGVDSRDSSVGRGANSDVNIIVSINRKTGEIRLVSVFRDTYLKTDTKSYNKINAAYCNGGPEQALKALNENLDLNITQYATFNWKAVATVIDILGGVDIELSKAEYYYINSYITATVQGTGIGSTQLTHAGMNHLDGVQAVAYARLRYMDNDYARTERQRKIIQLCLDKAKQTDLKTLTSTIGIVLDMCATNLTWEDGMAALGNLSKYHIDETAGFPFARSEGDVGKRGDCVIPQTLESNVIELHHFLFADEAYEPSEAVKNISAHISADTGLYTAGESIGHVSTTGVIAQKKPSDQPIPLGEATESETATGSNTGSRETSFLGESEGEEVEYAVSRDGYLIYVDSVDDEGNKKYKYVLDDNGDRIKMIEYDADGNPIYLYEVDEDGTFRFENGYTIKKKTGLNPEDVVTGVHGGPGVRPEGHEDDDEDNPDGPGANGPGNANYGPGHDGTEPSPTAGNNVHGGPGTEQPGDTPDEPPAEPQTDDPQGPGTTPGGTTPAGPGSTTPAGPGNTAPAGPGAVPGDNNYGQGGPGSNMNNPQIVEPPQ